MAMRKTLQLMRRLVGFLPCDARSVRDGAGGFNGGGHGHDVGATAVFDGFRMIAACSGCRCAWPRSGAGWLLRPGRRRCFCPCLPPKRLIKHIVDELEGVAQVAPVGGQGLFFLGWRWASTAPSCEAASNNLAVLRRMTSR